MWKYRNVKNSGRHFISTAARQLTRNVDVQTDRQGVKIEFESGTTRIWRNKDFSLQQDRSQGPLRLEYGEFPPEILEIADPEFGEVLGKRVPKKSRFFSAGICHAGSAAGSGDYLLGEFRWLPVGLRILFRYP